MRARRVVDRTAARVLDDLVAALFPSACRRCGTDLEGRQLPVPATARPYSALYSGQLRRSVVGPVSVPLLLLCPMCTASLRPGRRTSLSKAGRRITCISAFEPVPALFDLIHAFKYESCKELGAWFGAYLAAATRRCIDLRQNLQLLPVPLHPRREAQRGFNQSLVLAQVIGRRLGVPIRGEVVERCRETPVLARLQPAQRRASVLGAFRSVGSFPRNEVHWLLVDDVVTTGSTVGAVLDALPGDRPGSVTVLTLCRARDEESSPIG